MFYTQENTRGEPFYKLPQILFKDEKYKKLSSDAKILYSIMQNRVTLSEDNRWIDDDNRVFVYLTINEAMELINCSNKTAIKVLKELEDFELIKIERQGVKKPNKIFVTSLNVMCNNYISRSVKSTFQEVKKLHSSKNNINKTDISKNNYLSKAKALDRKPAFQIPLKDNSYYDIYEEDLVIYKELYSNIDIEQEIKNIIGWNLANISKRKTKAGIKKHINAWLSKSNLENNISKQGKEIIKFEKRVTNGNTKGNINKQNNEFTEIKDRINQFTTVL